MIGEMKDEADDHLFFNYLYNVYYECLQAQMKVEDECAARVMRMLDIDHDAVEDCIANSFVQHGNWDSYNLIL